MVQDAGRIGSSGKQHQVGEDSQGVQPTLSTKGSQKFDIGSPSCVSNEVAYSYKKVPVPVWALHPGTEHQRLTAHENETEQQHGLALLHQNYLVQVVNEHQGARWYCGPQPTAPMRTKEQKYATSMRTRGTRMFNSHTYHTC